MYKVSTSIYMYLCTLMECFLHRLGKEGKGGGGEGGGGERGRRGGGGGREGGGGGERRVN